VLLQQNDQQKMFGLQSMEDALALERFVNDMILSLHKKASNKGDAHVSIDTHCGVRMGRGCGVVGEYIPAMLG
jgi:hypothetical protein